MALTASTIKPKSLSTLYDKHDTGGTHNTNCRESLHTEYSLLMSTTAIIILVTVVLAVLAGGLLTLLSSAKTGMPDQDVLERARRHARQAEARDKEDSDH